MKILLIPGLTLPDISADDVARIRAAAGGDAEVVVTTQAEAPTHAAQAEVILGGVPRQLFRAAPRLRLPSALSPGHGPLPVRGAARVPRGRRSDRPLLAGRPQETVRN